MNQSITIRLTPTRERLLKLFKRRYNLKTNSEAIELALRIGFEDEVDYRTKIKQVTGCIKLENDISAVNRILSLRDVQ
jgi:hypothetical protein